MNAKASALKAKLGDKVGTVLSFPKRTYHDIKAAKRHSEASVLRTARAYDNAPNFDASGKPTNALKARTAADAIRSKYSK